MQKIPRHLPEGEAHEDDVISMRLNAVQNCVSWVEETFHNNQPIYDRDLICFSSSASYPVKTGNTDKCANYDDADKSNTPNKIKLTSSESDVGVFAKKDVCASPSTVLLSLPLSAVLSCDKASLKEGNVPVMQSTMQENMKKYRRYVEKSLLTNIYKKYDYYRHNSCRTIDESEVRLTIFLTFLLAFIERKNSSLNNADEMDPDLKEELETLTMKWIPYLNTWPHNFNSLPPFWSKDELDNIQGTSFLRYVTRVQKEYIENWDMIIRPALEEAGIYSTSSDKSIAIENHDAVLKLGSLPLFYKLAIGAVQSRTHGSSNIGEVDFLGRVDGYSMHVVLHPLLDLVNGERANEHVNVELEFDSHHSCMELRPTRDIKANEELILSYEDALSMSYLQRFGFLPMKDGLPDPDQGWLTLSLPLHLAPNENDKLRWKKLEELGFYKQNLTSEVFSTGPFALTYNNTEMQKYRMNPPRTPHTCPAQLEQIYNCGSVLLYNDKALNDIPQDPYIECYDFGGIMVTMIDSWLSELKTSNNEHDFQMIEKEKGNFRMGTFMRMLEREILMKWRHAICIRWSCYDYDEDECELSGFKNVPSKSSGTKVCYICNATFHVKKCTRCKQISYCGIKCQKEHWKDGGHKYICRKLSSA
jgi:hypothetical protein